MQELLEFLPCQTPDLWKESALQNPEILLIDHANCEKKAASSALHMMQRYIEFPDLLHKMSRLAREELRHFERVLMLMEKRGVAYRYIPASRYAASLRKHIHADEPQRLIDLLIIGALIEARSCERFAVLIPVVDEELASFYKTLLNSEARHFKDYLTLAEQVANESIVKRVNFFAELEKELILSADSEFRFHSGVVL